MTRHELKDGKWYLIRKIKYVNQGEWHVGMYAEHDDKFWIGTSCDNMDDYDEWVEIDPELAFTIFDNIKTNPELIQSWSGISSCKRGEGYALNMREATSKSVYCEDPKARNKP